jgi:hypothetical protein
MRGPYHWKVNDSSESHKFAHRVNGHLVSRLLVYSGISVQIQFAGQAEPQSMLYQRQTRRAEKREEEG